MSNKGIMKSYTVYFEIGSKKMRSTVFATSEEEAKQKISDKIIFHKIEENKSVFEDVDFKEMEDIFKSIFGGKL